MATSQFLNPDFLGLDESQSAHIIAPENFTITLDESAAYKYQIDTLIAKLSAGTITAAIEINGTPVTGITAQALTSVQSTGTATALRTVNIGDRVTLVLTANAASANLALTLKITRVA